MKFSVCMHGPWAALIFLAACNSRDATTDASLGTPVLAPAAAPQESPVEIGQVKAASSFGSLPACSSAEQDSTYFVDTPSNRVGFYRCIAAAWQLIGAPAGQGALGEGAGAAAIPPTLAQVSGVVIEIGVDDNGNGVLDPGEVDATGTLDADAGSAEPTDADVAPTDGDAAPTDGDAAPTCGDGSVGPGEECDLGSANGGAECQADCTLPPLGACLACAQSSCPTQYANAIGAASDSVNLAAVSQLFDCVIGTDWNRGNAIPESSCFFADPAQPLGSLVPCYCGNTPLGQCLSSGPIDNAEACGLEVEVASNCSPVTASCVTGSGSNPEVPLGDVLQLLNCERAACPSECGFPPPIEE